MDDPPTAIFRAKYNSLKTTFEGRLARLADTIRGAVESAQQDQVLVQLNSSVDTKEFAPAHAHALIKRYLASERDAFFHELALRLADAEAERNRCSRRNEELESSLSLLQSNASRGERSQMEATTVSADIRELRREYQVALEDAHAQCRQLKAELSHTKRRLGVLKEERDEQAAQSHSLEQALAKAETKVLDSLRLEYELREEKSVSAKLSSDLSRVHESHNGLSSSHRNLKTRNDALQNELSQRDRRLQLADVNRKKNEAQFREAVKRMESMMEEDAKESVVAIKKLRDKADLVKSRLSAEVDRLRAANEQLSKSLAAVQGTCLELELRLQAAQKSEETEASAAAAREEALRVEAEQARSRANAMSQSLSETIRQQSGLVTEAANAKIAAGVLEVKTRTAEMEVARAAGREAQRVQASIHDCAVSTVPGPEWEINNLLAEKLQEASAHISELRAVLRQYTCRVPEIHDVLETGTPTLVDDDTKEVRRREVAETEVSEARGYLNSSRQELKELRHLAWKLEQMGCNSIGHIDQKTQSIGRLESELQVRGVGKTKERTKGMVEAAERSGARAREGRTEANMHHVEHPVQESSTAVPGMKVGAGRGSGQDEETQLCNRGHTPPKTLFSGERFVEVLFGLRSELRHVTTQLLETKMENLDFVRRCADGVTVRLERLMWALRHARRKQVEAERQAFEAKVVGGKDKRHADMLGRVIQGISTILLDTLRVVVPTFLHGGDAVGGEYEGVLERSLSELAAAIVDAVEKAKGNGKADTLTKDSSNLAGDKRSRSTTDGMIWGERSKDDFNMLAQLRRIEADSELQSLKAQLEDMTEKYSRAIAEQETVDSAPLREERERTKKELARAARAHSGTVSALEATLAAEKARCQDMRMRVERQTREHQVAMAEADQRLLQTQEELDKAQQALEQAQFALERETARRVRLDKKFSDLEDRGLVSPRSVSPRVSRMETASRKLNGEPERDQLPLPRPSSTRTMLEEATAKLSQAGDALPNVQVDRQGSVPASRGSTREGDPPPDGQR